MPSFDIVMDLSGILNVTPALKESAFARIHDAIGTIADRVYSQWAADVQNARLWSKEKNDYIDSITWDFTGAFSAEVISSYKYAADIETGRPERDLKKMLDTSMKVRRTEDGRRFLVIPLRHGAQGSSNAMPFHIYQNARSLGKSSITGRNSRLSGEVTRLSPKSGMSKSENQSPFASSRKKGSDYAVRQRQYSWGDRLSGAGMSKQEKQKYAGMYRFQASSGSESRSKYMTFRMMMEGSSGWVVPAKPGLYIAKQVAERIQPVANEIIAKAVKLDLGL